MLTPTAIYTIIGKDESALDPAIIYIVNNTKFGRRLVKPERSIEVNLGTPEPRTDSIYKSKKYLINSAFINVLARLIASLAIDVFLSFG